MAGALRATNRQHRESTMTSHAAERQEVARLAYQLYEERGRTDGHDVEDWLKAEEIVQQSHANGAPTRS